MDQMKTPTLDEALRTRFRDQIIRDTMISSRASLHLHDGNEEIAFDTTSRIDPVQLRVAILEYYDEKGYPVEARAEGIFFQVGLVRLTVRIITHTDRHLMISVR